MIDLYHATTANQLREIAAQIEEGNVFITRIALDAVPTVTTYQHSTLQKKTLGVLQRLELDFETKN